MITKSDIELYFTAQKQAGWWFMIIGIAAVAAAVFCWQWQRNAFGRGLAIPLVLLGLVQCAAGFRVYKESDPLRISNVYALDMDPGKLKTKELPRMKHIQQRFTIYRWLQAIMLAAGVLLLVIFRQTPRSFWYGFGIGWSIQAAAVIIVYYFAAQRATLYIQKLEAFLQQLR